MKKTIILITCLLSSITSYSMNDTILPDKEFDSWLTTHALYPNIPTLDLLIKKNFDEENTKKIDAQNNQKKRTLPKEKTTKKSSKVAKMSFIKVYQLHCPYEDCDHTVEYKTRKNLIESVIMHMHLGSHKYNKNENAINKAIEYQKNGKNFYKKCETCNKEIEHTSLTKFKKKAIQHFLCTQRHNAEQHKELESKIMIITRGSK